MTKAVGSISPETTKRLRTHIDYAYRNVPFYRNLYDAAGVNIDDIVGPEDLPALPVVTKNLIIDDQEQSQPYGQFAVDPNDLARVSLIASRYFMFLTHKDWAGLTQLYVEAYRTMGVRPTDIVDLSSAFSWVQGGTQCDAALRELGAAVVPGGPGQSRQRMRVMRDLGVTALHAFTPYAEELAGRFTEYDIKPAQDLKIRLLMIGGELRDAQAKQRLQDAWGGAKIREFYGVSEAGTVAAECFEVGDRMHINSHCVVEVIDPDTGQQVDIGEPGEVVVTELFREAQPFVRYRTGDLTEGLIDDQCECGRRSMRLGRIIGRNSDILRVKGLFIQPKMVGQAVQRVVAGGVWRADVERTSILDEMTCHIETDLTPGVFAGLASAISSEIKNTVGIACAVVPVACGSIGAAAGSLQDLRNVR